ncbi:hypothetical protein B6U99_05440 [Candidatus Geothermarchaeota archaeon ex4572_27]|nr:MAG: hypothetical protein B6U99_05440 [Candidatus Geothermarchaeota archaeon ex4572_27]
MTEERKVISIRGVDRRLYEALSRAAREMGKTVGETLNEAITLFLTLREGVLETARAAREGLREHMPVIISNVEQLTLNANDLKAARGKLLIKDVGRLEIADDVTPELIEEKIGRIIRVNELVLPQNMPKTAVLAKAMYVKEVVTRGEA